MALSNWLTRGEWSAAYLVYLAGVDFSETPDPEALPWPVDLSFHLRMGICILHKCGYTNWGGIAVPDCADPDSVHKSEETRYGVNAITAEGDNGGCLVEVMESTLDLKTRAAETLVWMGEHPELDCPFLADLCQHLVNATPQDPVGATD